MSNLKKYRKVKYLGKGSYGAAILVELRADPSQKFVIKEIVIGHLKPNEQQSAKNEAEVLHQMNHSNITSYIESFVENSKLYIVMEHADGGDLSSAIQKKKQEGKFYDEDEIMRIFVQICLALKHVHSQNILHRDLKSQNIFLTLKGMVKLGDFGIAKVLDATDDQAKTQIGTPYYLSPEICESKPYGRKSDVWSLGVVLYELLALEMPFQASSLPALVHRICSMDPNYSKIENRYSQSLVSLCKQLLLKNAESRPEVGQIVRGDFIKEHISRLLSYTIKTGTGGVDNGSQQLQITSQQQQQSQNKLQQQRQLQQQPLTDDQIREMDAEEAESNIEKYREREKLNERELHRLKDRESKDAAVAKDRQQQAEENREKLKKIRQEMITNNRKPVSGGEAKGEVRALSPSRAQSPKGRGAAVSGQRNINEPPRVNPYTRQQQSPASLAIQQPSRENNWSNANNIRERDRFKEREGATGGRGMKSLANIQAEKQQQQQQHPSDVVVLVPGGVGRGEGYEDYARREYFERRAAAQAVKAKVEAAERGYVLEKQPSPADVSPIVVEQRPTHRRPSDTEYADMDPEQRIAMIRAQKEKEMERKNAEQEMKMKKAIEEAREQRRKSAENNNTNNRAKAIAFDIDISSDKVEPKNLKTRGTPTSVEDDRTSDSGNSNKYHNKPTPVVNQKKGWGPPCDANDILQARAIGRQEASQQQQRPHSPARSNESKLNGNSDIEETFDKLEGGTPSTTFDHHSGNYVKERKRQSQLEVRNQAKDVLSKLRHLSSVAAAKQEQQHQRRYHQHQHHHSQQRQQLQQQQEEERRSKVNNASPVRGRVTEVSAADNKLNIKERRLSAENKSNTTSRTQSPATAISTAVTPFATGHVPVSRSRSNSNASSRSDTNTDQLTPQSNSPVAPINKLNSIEELSNELEDTLSNWLENQMRAVTVRKKPSKQQVISYLQKGDDSKRGDRDHQDYKGDDIYEDEGYPLPDEELDDLLDDDNALTYKSASKPSVRNRKDGGRDSTELRGRRDELKNSDDSSLEEDLFYGGDNTNEEEYDIHRPLKGKFMEGDDVEVVGMQCMLAKALLGEDDDNDGEEGNDR